MRRSYIFTERLAFIGSIEQCCDWHCGSGDQECQDKDQEFQEFQEDKEPQEPQGSQEQEPQIMMRQCSQHASNQQKNPAFASSAAGRMAGNLACPLARSAPPSTTCYLFIYMLL